MNRRTFVSAALAALAMPFGLWKRLRPKPKPLAVPAYEPLKPTARTVYTFTFIDPKTGKKTISQEEVFFIVPNPLPENADLNQLVREEIARRQNALARKARVDAWLNG